MNGYWNFEGSLDGTQWDILHASRGGAKLDLYLDCAETFFEAKMNISEFKGPEQNISDRVLDTVEHEFRYTWELTPPPTQFYRFFRIIGAGGREVGGFGCLQWEGIELYFYVREE